MKGKVSIIIPVYNVENYLMRCIDSILNQTYNNLEIILIDDGSTDSSGKICDDYLLLDNRVVVIHKKNGGLSDARNKGISVSTGEFLMFIDSDDYIDSDMVESLIDASINFNKSIACCAKYIEKECGEYYIKNYSKEVECYSKEETIKMLLTNNKIDTSACDKLFKKELFKNIKFPYGKVYEDLATIYQVVELTDGTVHIGNPKYHYIQRNGSIINSDFNSKHLQYVEVSKSLVEHYKKNNEIKDYALVNYYLAVVTTIMDIKMKKAVKKYNSEYILLKREIKNNIISILKNKKISITKRIMILFIFFNLVKSAYFIKLITKKIKSKTKELSI